MSREGKGEGTPGLVTGRIEELRRLEAAERALTDAIADYARAAAGGGRLLHLAERQQRVAALLADRIVALGGTPDEEPDDIWIIGPPQRIDTILYAEHAAQRTYHDHLLDMDPDTMQLIRDHILPEHDYTLALLEEERDQPALEPV